MEILGCVIFAIVICALGSFATKVIQSVACNDCPLKDKCEQSIKAGNGKLCDDNNQSNNLMPL